MSTYGLDSKDILKLDKGPSSNVVTVIPDSVATDVVALGPVLTTNNNTGVIPYRETTSGHLKAVTVTSPITFMNGVLTGPAAATLTSLLPDWQHNNNKAIEAIKLEYYGMLSSGGGGPPPAFTYELSNAADFGGSQFGTVAVQNINSAYAGGTTYLVQVKTKAMEGPKTPVLITQVAPTSEPGGRWPHLCNMPCGVIPSKTPGFFNIWFTPNPPISSPTIVKGSEIWFHWFIPYRPEPEIIDNTTKVEPALPL
jgi:hypothetical protein